MVAPSSLDGACAADASAYCSAFAQKAPDVFAERYLDAPACVTRVSAGCKLVLMSPDTGWTPEARLACAAAWATATAEQIITLTAMPMACRAPAGKKPDGTACGLPSDCASGACVIGRGQTCGVCAPRAKAGAACIGWSNCEDDLDCNYDAAGNGTCGAPKTTLVPIGTPCSNREACGLRYCRGTWVWSDPNQTWSLSGGTCQPYTTVGAGSACGYFEGPGTATAVPILDMKNCGGPSRCVYPTEEALTGMCQAQPSTGQACNPELGCQELSVCRESICVALQPSASCK